MFISYTRENLTWGANYTAMKLDGTWEDEQSALIANTCTICEFQTAVPVLFLKVFFIIGFHQKVSVSNIIL